MIKIQNSTKYLDILRGFLIFAKRIFKNENYL